MSPSVHADRKDIMELPTTRDSVFWKLLFWGGVVLAVVVEALNVIGPAELGLSLKVVAWLRLFYAITIGLGGKMGLSALPSSKDKEMKVNLSKLTGPLVLLLAFAMYACDRPVTITTPEGKAAYTANEILKRVQNLQNATIEAAASGGLSTNSARVIITFTVESAKVLDATPTGWGGIIATAWNAAKKQLPATVLTNPVIQAAAIAVDVALAVYLPPKGPVQ